MNNKTINNKYQYTPELLQQKINEYFEYIDKRTETTETKHGIKEKKYPCTITSLCNFLDINTSIFRDYRKNELFSSIIKKAMDMIETRFIELACTRDIDNTTAIFYLKNYFKYSDKQEIKQDTTSTNTNYNYDFSNKSDDEIKQLLEAANNGEDIDI